MKEANVNGKKIAIIDSGLEGRTAFLESMIKAGIDSEVEIVDLQQEDILERLRGESEPYIIRNIPRPQLMPVDNPKPTCSKHHEYVQSTSQEGNLVKSIWRCRHCNKTL